MNGLVSLKEPNLQKSQYVWWAYPVMPSGLGNDAIKNLLRVQRADLCRLHGRPSTRRVHCRSLVRKLAGGERTRKLKVHINNKI